MAMWYEKYKESEIWWLTDIPYDWKETKLKWILTKENREQEPDAELLICTNKGKVVKRGDQKIGLVAADYSIYQGVKSGDLLIHGMDTWHGAIAVSDMDGICTTVVHVCSSSQNKYYIAYYLQFMAIANVFKLISNGVRQNTSDFRSWDKAGNLPLPLPSLSEQNKIAAFLKSKTALIDKAIEGKLRQQTLLREAKQSLIAEAVTKGINHNVPLKDSGISWLGEIPEHWEVKRMKFCFTQTSIKGFPCEQPLCSTQAYGVIPQAMYENRIVVANAGLENQKLVNVGDFVISLRSFEGGIEYAYYRGIISAAYTILSPNDATMSPYNKCLFKSFPFIQLLKTCVTGIREGQNINYDLLKNKFLPVPPLAEQQAIVEHIESKTQKIDAMITTLDKQVEQLKAYRQRLIADVVTGQKKVC